MSQATISLRGGLQLTQSKRLAPSGSLIYCKNFEIGPIDGYTSVEGFVRYDGRRVYFDVNEAYSITSTAIPSPATGFIPGIVVNYGTDGVGIILGRVAPLSISLGVSPAFELLSVEHIAGTPPASGQTLTGEGYYSSGTFTIDEVSTKYTSSFSLFLGRGTEAYYNDSVTKVPGGPITEIPGVCIYKNRTYVVAEYRGIVLANGSFAAVAPLEGDLVRRESDSANIGKIVKMTLTGGDWGAAGTGTGIWLIDTSGYADVALVNADVIEIYRSATATVIAEYDEDTNETRCGLLYCDYVNDQSFSSVALETLTNRWNRVTLGREIPYLTGTTAPLSYVRPGFVADQGATTAGTVTEDSDEAYSANSGWTDQVNGEGAADGVFTQNASATTPLPHIDFKFDLSDIPDGATILGVKVTITRRTNAGTTHIKDHLITLIGLTGPVFNYADQVQFWPASNTARVYGSTADRWGNALQVQEVKGDDFGVRVQPTVLTTATAQIDSVQIEVTYEPQTETVYVRDTVTPADLGTIKIVHHTVEDGAFADNDARGVIIVADLPTDAEKTQLYGPGLQLRTAAGGAGNLIAVTAGPDQPITLPSKAELKAANKRYELIEASPYAQDDSEILIICSGVERAYMFDGEYLLPIRTGLDNEYEKPSFAAYWGNNLFLGYDAGTMMVSSTGNPISFIGGDDASEIAVSDKITGLMPLKGQALAVFTQHSIQAIYGRDVSTFNLEIIASTIGAVPYSAIDIGVPLFLDNQGVQTLQAVQAYGNFARGRLSDAVTPWLRDRIQAGCDGSRGFVGALKVRNKSQLRLVFRDGWILTGTFLSEGSMVFTTQRFELDDSDTDAGVRVLGLASGVFNDGREGLFFTMDGRFEEERNRYVYKMDSGVAFDDVTPNYSLVTSFEHNESPTYSKTLQRLSLFAEAVDANLSISIGRLGFDGRYDQVDECTQLPAYTGNTRPLDFDYTQTITGTPIIERPGGVALSAEVTAESEAFSFAITMTSAVQVTLQELVIKYKSNGKEKG